MSKNKSVELNYTFSFQISLNSILSSSGLRCYSHSWCCRCQMTEQHSWDKWFLNLCPLTFFPEVNNNHPSHPAFPPTPTLNVADTFLKADSGKIISNKGAHCVSTGRKKLSIPFSFSWAGSSNSKHSKISPAHLDGFTVVHCV